MIRVYVASSFLNKDAVRKAEATLREAGFEVTSQWVNHETAQGDPVELRQQGEIDLSDLLHADVLLVLWPGRLGTASEIGVAIGAEVPIYIIKDDAPIDMPFAYLPEVHHLGAVEQFIRLMKFGGVYE